MARKPPKTHIRGVIGCVPRLYEVLDENLQAKGWNWSTLAEKAGYTRTNVIKVTEQDVIPYDTLVRLCAPLGLNPDHLIEEIEHEVQVETDRPEVTT